MIRTLILVEVPFYCQGLKELLCRSGEVEVVAAVSSAAEAERMARLASPDVVLLDISAGEAREAMRRLRGIERAPRIVALAVRETPESVLEWAESGIAGYVPRDASLGALIRALQGVVRGEVYCSPQIAATLIGRLASLAASSQRRDGRVEGLSAREHEVLSLVARGLSNKAIAARLGIANATAKNHVHNILDKLHLRARGEAASLLHRDGEPAR